MATISTHQRGGFFRASTGSGSSLANTAAAMIQMDASPKLRIDARPSFAATSTANAANARSKNVTWRTIRE
jgi:hypothetical protein